MNPGPKQKDWIIELAKAYAMFHFHKGSARPIKSRRIAERLLRAQKRVGVEIVSNEILTSISGGWR